MSQPTKHLYEFGSFRLEPDERLLLRDGKSIALTPKAFDLLLVLVERHGHLFEKEELLRRVWPDTFVEEGSLTWNISYLRKALDENGDGPGFIETVPKRGYRFVGNVKVTENENLYTQDHTKEKRPAEGVASASQDSAEAAIDTSSPILTGRIPATPNPSNGGGYVLEPLPPTPAEQPETDTPLPVKSDNDKNRWMLRHWQWIWIAWTALVGLTAFVVGWYGAPRPLPEARLMLSILPMNNSSFDAVTISPDGRWLAFTASTDSRVQLWVRPVDAAEAKALPGTDDARLPFWSPDSHYLGFFVGRQLKRIEVPDGPPTTLCDTGVGTGGTWSRDGVILFTSLGGAGVSLVSAEGGGVTSVIRADLKRLETDYKDPSFLPDGRNFLYFNSSGEKEIRGVYVASIDGRVNRRLLADDSNAIYASSANGGSYLLFGREGALMAQPFDTLQLKFTDEPFSVAGQVGRVLNSHARRSFSVSDNGVLVFDPLSDRQRNQLIWVDRAGVRTNHMDGQQTHNPSMHRLSPDDTRFIENRFDVERGSNDLWVTNLTNGILTRFTFDPATDLDAVWSPDGSRIVWCSNRQGQFNLYQNVASSGGDDELLWVGPDYPKHPTDWSGDGRFIIYTQTNPSTKADVWVLPVGPPTGDPFAFLQSEHNEGAAVLSPDGRWMAYISDESGRYEVYVRGFPGGRGKQQISTSGGLGPLWRSNGREMYYHATDGRLMNVPVNGGLIFEAAEPVPLFAFRPAGNRLLPYYSVTRDGKRFLLSTIIDKDTRTPLTVILNWSAGLKR